MGLHLTWPLADTCWGWRAGSPHGGLGGIGWRTGGLGGIDWRTGGLGGLRQADLAELRTWRTVVDFAGLSGFGSQFNQSIQSVPASPHAGSHLFSRVMQAQAGVTFRQSFLATTHQDSNSWLCVSIHKAPDELHTQPVRFTSSIEAVVAVISEVARPRVGMDHAGLWRTWRSGEDFANLADSADLS
eukprot:gene16059-biopygen3285